MSEKPRRGVLLGLAVEGMVPVVGGCAGAVIGGPEGGLVGVAAGQAVEKIINFFGGRIVDRWAGWFAVQSPEMREKAMAELAATTPTEARAAAEHALADAPGSPADKEVALVYLSLLPGAIDRAMTRQPDGGRSVPATMSFEAPSLLSLMPMHLPPYPVGHDVAGTPYHLEALLGSGGFGAVYKATTRTLQHLPLAVKFCLDPNMAQSLHRERGMLERLMKAGGESWSPRVVRLYGYDLDHKTPHLVYEFVTGGDLIRYLNNRRTELGRALNPAEVRGLIRQVVEGLAFAHGHGLVHRDLKPANVLVEGGLLKLGDFGLGGVTAQRAALVSRIGASTHGMLDAAEQATLFRGAGTPLYMAPEQRRGLAPDPRHDLYSLGVMWYQLLVGDVTRELHPGWARELSVRAGVPQGDIDLIGRCVGWVDERPIDGAALLALMDGPAAPAAVALTDMRRSLLVSLMRQLTEAQGRAAAIEGRPWTWAWWTAGVAVVLWNALVEGQKFNPALATFVTAPVTVGVGLTLWLVRTHILATARERAAETVGTLKEEFPEAVAGWGGEAVLENPATALTLLEQVNPPAVAADSPGSMSGPQKAEFKEALEKLGERHKAAGTPARPFGLVLAAVLALGLGIGAGVFAATKSFHLRGPYSRLNERGVRDTLSVAGHVLTVGEFTAEARREEGFALTLGGGVGAGVAVLAFVLLSRFRWYQGALFVAALGAPFVAAAVGVAAVGAYHSVHSPEAVTEDGVKKYVNAAGQALSWREYVVEERKTYVWGRLIGEATGAVAGLLTIAACLAWHHGRSRQARAEAEAIVADVTARFPQAVAATSGPDRLRTRAGVEAALGRLG